METLQIDLSGAKILIVDDTPDNLRLLRQALEPEGYSILVATNGETALKIAQSAHPELILLDIQMPGIDGFETCRRLKANAATQDISIIFVTAKAETEAIVEGFHLGGVDYIVKPFQNEEVLVRVETHLKMDRLTRDLAASNREIQLGAERKSRFLSNMSHEIRTPMTAILGQIDNMLDGIGGELNERQTRSLDRVKHNADFMLELVNDLLDLSKIEAGRLDTNPATFSFLELVEECASTVGHLIQPDVALLQDIAPEVGTIHSDPTFIRQIVMNLLSNALKFTPQGRVTVSAAIQQDQLVIQITDTGIGIPKDALDTIFEEFHQVKRANPQHKGTGLGLAITRKLTEHLGGSIRVESEVDKGSTFTVHLPIVCPHPDPQTPLEPKIHA